MIYKVLIENRETYKRTTVKVDAHSMRQATAIALKQNPNSYVVSVVSD